MAGLGAKLFASFSKLTAAQVNGYLMDQTIMRFATSAARDAAFGGAGEPTLAEGMTCYLDDTNEIQSYTGTAWVSVTSGLVYVTSSAISGTTFNLDSIFTSTYSNYLINIDNITSTGNHIYLKMRSGGTPTSTGYYGAQTYVDWAGVISAQGLANNATTGWQIIYTGSTGNMAVINLFNPQVASKVTTMTINSNWNILASASGGGYQSATTQFDGLSLISASSMGGTITVYGYRK